MRRIWRKERMVESSSESSPGAFSDSLSDELVAALAVVLRGELASSESSSRRGGEGVRLRDFWC